MRHLTRYLSGMALAAGSLAACERAEVRRERPLLLAGLPVVGDYVLTDTTGAEDAQRLTLEAPLPYDSVRSFYRTILRINGWQGLSERGDSTGVLMMAHKDSVSLWITIRWLDSNRTEYTLIGGRSTEPARPTR